MRYQRDSARIQLGGLASNLSRIAYFAQRAERQQALPVFRESKYFTEWVASSASLEQQGLLADLQRDLAWWERCWDSKLTSNEIAEEAQRWSDELLNLSGLIESYDGRKR